MFYIFQKIRPGTISILFLHTKVNHTGQTKFKLLSTSLAIDNFLEIVSDCICLTNYDTQSD